MGKGRETYGKKDVRSKQEKKRKEKEQKRLERRESKGSGNPDDMIAYVDEFGNITSTPPETQRTTVNVEDITIGVPKNLEPDPQDSIYSGTVTFFDESKGYGFIKDSLTKQGIFVHANGLLEPIKEGNKVSFEVIKGPKGLNAINVKVDRD
jgi:cold shock CspA family protein